MAATIHCYRVREHTRASFKAIAKVGLKIQSMENIARKCLRNSKARNGPGVHPVKN